MQPVVSVKKMIAAEKKANADGLSYTAMMENAGTGIAELILKRYFNLREKPIIGLIGSGNNGGDTLIGLRFLQENGWKTTAVLLKQREKNDPLLDALTAAGGTVREAYSSKELIETRDVFQLAGIILDGVLGTGIKLPIKPELSDLLETTRSMISGQIVIAVDCPSGVDCNTGEVSPACIPAALTVCMAAVKEGLLKFPAFDFVGEITVVKIGINREEIGNKGELGQMVTSGDIKTWLPGRPRLSHKGSFGTCMIVGGSVNYCGAVLLAAMAAYRIGSGLIRTAIPNSIFPVVAGQIPEATWILLPEKMGVISEGAHKVILRNLDHVSALLIGPGIGLEKETENFIFNYLHASSTKSINGNIGFVHPDKDTEKEDEKPTPNVVIDADGLKLISKIQAWWEKIPEAAVLTPHPGEMAVMTGKSIGTIQKERISTARFHAKKWGHVVVLKGAITIIASPDGEIVQIPIASAALATAGTGDVLAGMITGLISQGLNPYKAAICGCYVHAYSGKLCAEKPGGKFSTTARDVIEMIPFAIEKTLASNE